MSSWLPQRVSDIPPYRNPSLTWGRWRYDRELMVLDFWRNGHDWYQVDLERCRDSAQILDRIMQLSDKSWCSDDDLRQLLRAIRDLLHPQALFCSWGRNHRHSRVELRRILERRAAELVGEKAHK